MTTPGDDGNVEYGLVLAFDSDHPEFTRGFEAGQIWADMQAGLAVARPIHVTNVEMVMRMCEANGYSFTATRGDDEWTQIVLTPGPQAGRLCTHLRGDGPCGDCGTVDNLVWFTDNVLWNQVMSHPAPPPPGDPGGIVCIVCFVIRAHAAGLDPVAWRLLPDWPWRTRSPQ